MLACSLSEDRPCRSYRMTVSEGDLVRPCEAADAAPSACGLCSYQVPDISSKTGSSLGKYSALSVLGLGGGGRSRCIKLHKADTARKWRIQRRWGVHAAAWPWRDCRADKKGTDSCKARVSLADPPLTSRAVLRLRKARSVKTAREHPIYSRRSFWDSVAICGAVWHGTQALSVRQQ